MNKPGPLQFIAYAYGKRLPDSMREWVAHDLADHGAVRRHMIRMAIPPLLVLAPFWLLPASLYVHLEMTAPIYIWAILMALALNKVWRRHRLAQHGWDPNLVDEIQPEAGRPHPRGLRPQVRAAPRRGPLAVQQQPVLGP